VLFILQILTYIIIKRKINNYHRRDNVYPTVYSYDANNRLLTSDKDDGAAIESTVYHYDPNGNQYGKMVSTTSAGSSSECYYLVNGKLSTLDESCITLIINKKYDAFGKICTAVDIFAGKSCNTYELFAGKSCIFW